MSCRKHYIHGVFLVCFINNFCRTRTPSQTESLNKEKIIECVQSIVHDMTGGKDLAVKVEISEEQLEVEKGHDTSSLVDEDMETSFNREHVVLRLAST